MARTTTRGPGVGVSFATGLAGSTVAAIVVRHLGWVGDLVALAYPLLLLLLLPLAVAATAARFHRAAALAAAAVLVLAVMITLPRRPQHSTAPRDPVRITTVNLQFDSKRPESTVGSAIASRPDVLVVSEVTPRTDALLRAAFLHHVINENVGVQKFGQGVYSNVPIERLPMDPSLRADGLRVRVNGPTPFVLYAVHLPRPTIRHDSDHNVTSFAGSRAAAVALDRLADAEVSPVVIAGDLNLSDRTSGYRVLERGRRDALRGGWAGRTYVGSGAFWSVASLRIDHMFVPDDWCYVGGRRFDVEGSDHRGIEASVGRCP